jgi:hypothetical protein
MAVNRMSDKIERLTAEMGNMTALVKLQDQRNNMQDNILTANAEKITVNAGKINGLENRINEYHRQ